MLWFGRDIEHHLFPPSAIRTETFHYPKFLQALYNLVLKSSRDGNPRKIPELQRSNPLAWPQLQRKQPSTISSPSCAVCSHRARSSSHRAAEPPLELFWVNPTQSNDIKTQAPISNKFTQLLNTRTIFGVNKLPEEPRTGQVPRATPTAQIGH